MRHQTTLRFIDAIARAGSIRRAAERMSITPSALNRRVLAIEEELNAPLFERMAVGVRLSAAGELFVAHARRQLADMDRVRSQIEDMKGARRGHVTFGFDRALVPDGFGEALARYRSDHPDVSFEVRWIGRDEAVRSLKDYRVDLAGIVEPSPDPAIRTLATAPVEVKAVMAPSHPLADQTSVGFNEVLPHPLVLPASGSLRQLLAAGAARQDYDLRPVLEGSLAFAGATIQTGEAIGFSMNTASRTETGLPDTTAVPFSPRDLSPPTLHLLQLKGRALSVPAGRFADVLATRFARYSGEA